ncbi:MAG: hypothetical protein OEY20_10060 [Gemmatimonadota bacterium]|nr:hypothetical protein [Gemmatimonadota bacterium]MDH4351635.1 hypothetical protein [Gemmatimonadota bacterium]MDH5197584.1 hypothetical protein [Gemmatimonadota bacterium]
MIELKQDRLIFRFPEVHDEARVSIEFQRTLRIPDDDREYPLPPGLGRFPLRHVDDFVANVPGSWIEHGGVMLPMYQSEALWVNFSGGYPCAVKVATGKIDAVTGKTLRPGLGRRPQNYVAIPEQPWLDGYCVEQGVIRQFVAMPLGAGYTAEEQITGEAEHGGLQVLVYPMKAEAYERLRSQPMEFGRSIFAGEMLCRSATFEGMGLAPGGRMRQQIFDDPHDLEDWDQAHVSRCFVHLANSLVWRQITDEHPPTVPPTAREYANAGLPWFEYYDDHLSAVRGSGILDKLKSVVQLGSEKGDVPVPENASVQGMPIVELRKGLRKGQVREGRF